MYSIKENPTYYSKNLLWYKYGHIFVHIHILYTIESQDCGLLVDLQDHYYMHYREEIVSKPLLSGLEIMNILNLKTSKEVGNIKERLFIAQLEGKVKTKDEAIRYVKNLRETI
ncbi:MAG: hypothetical protein N2Z80_03200 [Hydrogenothermaceae bacterium]|nr:hypothetical protein [Hydrogenothermaceae bacterium]